MGTTYQSVILNAPADTIWNTIKNFHDLSWAPNVITKVTIVGDKGASEVGAKRVLNDAFHETLTEVNDATKTLRYQIDDGPSPISKDDVKNYIGTIQIRPVTEGGGTFFEWSSKWEQNDAAVHEFCHGIYVALLGELKNKFS